MLTKDDLPNLVGEAIENFKTNNRRGDVAHNDDLKRIIEDSTGAALYDGAVRDIRADMIQRQQEGFGVESGTTSGSAWRFLK